MQTIHKVCLILTVISVLMISVGIGFGVAHNVKSDTESFNDTFTEYEAYDEDYVDSNSSVISHSGVIQLRTGLGTGVIGANEQEKVANK